MTKLLSTYERELLIFIMILIIVTFILVGVSILINKSNKNSRQPNESFDTLLGILLSMISVELDLYEKEIFNDRMGITNANFANFMQDICSAINSHISPDFMRMITVYVTEDFVYTLITKKVKAYLVSKVA